MHKIQMRIERRSASMEIATIFDTDNYAKDPAMMCTLTGYERKGHKQKAGLVSVNYPILADLPHHGHTPLDTQRTE